MIKIHGMATVIRLTRSLCRILTKIIPRIEAEFPEPERTLLIALHVACSELLEEYPNIGYS